MQQGHKSVFSARESKSQTNHGSLNRLQHLPKVKNQIHRALFANTLLHKLGCNLLERVRFRSLSKNHLANASSGCLTPAIPQKVEDPPGNVEWEAVPPHLPYEFACTNAFIAGKIEVVAQRPSPAILTFERRTSADRSHESKLGHQSKKIQTI